MEDRVEHGERERLQFRVIVNGNGSSSFTWPLCFRSLGGFCYTPLKTPSLTFLFDYDNGVGFEAILLYKNHNYPNKNDPG